MAVGGGLRLGLLDMIARDLGLEYELVEYDSFSKILEAVEKGKVDVVTALAVTAPRETIVDFSHPFLSTGSAIAVPVPVSRPGLFDFTGGFVDRFVSLDFLIVIAMLILLSLAAGALVWLFERRIGNVMFSGKGVNGLWQGLWWAMVTGLWRQSTKDARRANRCACLDVLQYFPGRQFYGSNYSVAYRW